MFAIIKMRSMMSLIIVLAGESIDSKDLEMSTRLKRRANLENKERDYSYSALLNPL